jgi:hypothetical protein
LDQAKYCVLCGSAFEAKDAYDRYCSDLCASKKWHQFNRHTYKMGDRHCRQCGTVFTPSWQERNRLHCSLDCAKKSARESRSKFWDRQPNPRRKMQEYRQVSLERVGPDGNLKRFRRRYPDVKIACESCGESRVVDIAHKPAFKRNGAWRSVKNTTPEKVWILCPTCHALIDRMNYPPSELGLSE